MPDWLLRTLESRRVRNLTLGGIGFMIAASSGGALLANYTVAGMNPMYRASPETRVARVEAERQDTRWLRAAVFEEPRYSDGVALETDDARYGGASY